jgi:hypothetical protein
MSAFAVGSFNSDGTPNDFQTRIRSGFISVTKNATYTLSVGNYNTAKGSISTSVSFYANNTDTTTRLSYINWVNGATSTFTIPSDAKFIRFLVRIGDQTLELSDIDKVQVELGSSASVFEPYQPIQTVTIDLDGTRYGGTLNVLTGTMTVTKVEFDATSDLTYGTSSQGTNCNVFQIALPSNNLPSSVAYTAISNRFSKNIPSDTPGRMVHPGNTIYFVISKSEVEYTVASLKTWLDNHPTQFVYELATPFTVQLTPSQLAMLEGTNVLWSDTGNIEKLTYYRSVEMALNTMYPAKNGSPKTTLSQDITAAATSMVLADVSVLPPAPNLAVLGEEETAEIVLYNEISGNVVSGMIRGINGTTASVWTSGTSVARNFTSYDHDTIIENFLTLDTEKAPLASPALTGTPTAPTASAGDNSTQIATTAFLQREMSTALAKEVMYFTNQTVSVASSAQIMRIPSSGTNSNITTNTVVLECSFANPAAITSDVSWTSYAGYITFSGTCTSATTANVTLGTKGN